LHFHHWTSENPRLASLTKKIVPIWYYILKVWLPLPGGQDGATMFALTRKTDYAIIAMCDMARRPGQICKARQIADRFNVPSALLIKVLKVLAHAELIRSMRGVNGGYTLALPAERITLAAIIETVEGPVKFVQCATDPEPGESPCELLHVCPVSRPIRKIHNRLAELLNEITLADIAYDHEEHGQSVAVSVEGNAVRMEPTR